MLFSLFLNALMLRDETISPSRAFQRLITRCEKKYFLTSFWHLGLKHSRQFQFSLPYVSTAYVVTAKIFFCILPSHCSHISNLHSSLTKHVFRTRVKAALLVQYFGQCSGEIWQRMDGLVHVLSGCRRRQQHKRQLQDCLLCADRRRSVQERVGSAHVDSAVTSQLYS